MSLYNMINGFNPSCIFFMPMLGRKQEEYPRFRDCFLTEENNIAIYTRVGGGNRNIGYGEEELYKDPNFIRTYDDDYDETYGTYEFKVPEKWKADFAKIINGDMRAVSDEYVEMLEAFYPKLAGEGLFRKMFRWEVEEKENA